ncbi:MAG: hypothetical protein JXA42_18515 [Anaerolineales bacterium]|nr:hypothetical protein [Anaerolineales bacterium]
METMEIVKYVSFYAMEAIVVALVGVTLFAGLYQLVRDALRRKEPATPVTQPVDRS